MTAEKPSEKPSYEETLRAFFDAMQALSSRMKMNAVYNLRTVISVDDNIRCAAAIDRAIDAIGKAHQVNVKRAKRLNIALWACAGIAALNLIGLINGIYAFYH